MYKEKEMRFPKDQIIQKLLIDFLSEPQCCWPHESSKIKFAILKMPLLKWNCMVNIFQKDHVVLEKTKLFCQFLLRPNNLILPHQLQLKNTKIWQSWFSGK